MLRPQYPLWLAGSAVGAQSQLSVENKFTHEVAAEVGRGDEAVLTRAIDAAVAAFEETRRLPGYSRAEILQYLVDQLRERRDEFAHVLAIEAGKPIRTARGEVDRAQDTFRIAAEEATRQAGEQMPMDISPRAAGYSALWRRFPIGPVGLITPFNFPLNLVAHKVAPAIAMGCPFVLKPASSTPICALLLAEILAETDWPAGACSVIPCSGQDAAPLVEDERLKLLTFTGSPEVGWELKARARKKRVSLELGGNAACIVDEGADVAFAAERITLGAFGYAGQSCISVQRVLAHRSLHARLRDELVRRAEPLKMGDPLDEATDLGPLITVDDAKRVEQWVADAVSAGANTLCGGGRKDAIHPATWVENVLHDQKLSCQEVFGPVATLEPFDDFDAALRIANDSDFGLQAGVFTRDWDRAWRAYDVLDVGGVVINDIPSMRVDSMPYGGVKDSGQGREGVRFAMEEMSELKVLLWRRGAS